MQNNLGKVALAEFVGSFALIFVGVLAISGSGIAGEGAPGLLAIALAHGLTITVMVAALGGVSGGHISPVVTFGFLITGRMNVMTGLVYMIAQLAGAVVAAFILTGMFGVSAVGQGTPHLGPGISSTTGIIIEAIASFFLVFVIFGTAVDERAPKSVFPIAIGMTVVLDILAFGPISGAAMNPARVFGPALASGYWDNHVVYWIGGLVGGALGALVQHAILMRRAPSSTVAERGGPSPSEERGTR